jgi:hydrogenase/urease accessory protein HupE
VSRRASCRWIAAVAAGWALLIAPLAAHPVPFSYLDIRLAPDAIEATLVIHIFDLGHDLGVSPPEQLLDPAFVASRAADIAALAASRLQLAADGRALTGRWSDPEVLADRQSIRIHWRHALDRPAGVVTVEGTLFPYDPQHQTFINVYETELRAQAMIDHAHTRFEYFAGSRQGVLAVVEKFVPSGVHHILIGPDHILFLVGLLLTGGSLRRLALIVTGFTVAHSLTLSLAALNLVTPPARLIEPAIALSIVVVGADNLMAHQGRDLRAWFAFGFGFIHGFGFANVLLEMSLPARALGWSLLSFNVGVEIGQLLVVAVVATALAAVRSRSDVAARRVTFVGSIGVVAAGAFWFVQRVMFPGGS